MLRYASWALALYIVLLGSEELFPVETGIGVVYLVGLATLGLFLLALARGEVRLHLSLVAGGMVVFALLALVSTFWSVDPDRTQYYSLLLLRLLLTTWITATCMGAEVGRPLLLWALLASSLYPAVTLVQNAFDYGFLVVGGRLALEGADPNLTAFRFVISILVAVHLGLHERRAWRRVPIFAVAGLFAMASLTTGSRGGLLALSFSLLMYFAFALGTRPGRSLLALGSLGLAVTLAFQVLPEGLTARYLGIGQEVATGDMAKRKDIYREARGSIDAHPMFGVGYLAYQSASRQSGGLNLAAHNDPLQATLDLGLLGLAVWAWMAGGLACRAIQAGPNRALACSILGAYLVMGLSITLLGAKITWVVFGAVLGLGHPGRVRLTGSRTRSQACPEGAK